MAKEKKEYTFQDLNKEMRQHSEYGETIDKSDISTIDHYIDSGNYHLNACLSGSLFGGYPNNRSVALAGPSGVGKTYLLLNALKRAQDMGYYVIFYDSENAVDRDLVIKFGLDPSKFRYEPCTTVQQFRSNITSLTDVLIENKKKGFEIPKIIISLDSAGMLATQKEIDDAKSGSEKADMTRPKILKSTFRIIMSKLAICKIPFIFTNHTYQTMDLFSQTVAGGGTGPEYAASIILFLTKAKLKEGTEQTGIIITAKPNKNRCVKPTAVKFHLSFSKGMNRFVGLEEYINWDTCGIGRGKALTQKEYEKLSSDEKKDCRYHSWVEEDNEKSFWFKPSATSRKLVVAHLNDSVDIAQLFTSTVITKEVLDKLEPIVANKFRYESDGGDDSIVELINDIVEDDNQED